MAYLRASTVFAALTTLFACVLAILATLGGLNKSAVRDLPWLSSQVSIGGLDGVTRFWVGLWEGCSATSVSVICAPLSELYKLSLVDVTGTIGSVSISLSDTDERNFTETYVKSLPYTHIAAASLFFLTFLAAFCSSTLAAVLSMMAMIVQAAAFGSAAFFMSRTMQLAEDQSSRLPSFLSISRSIAYGPAYIMSASALGLSVLATLVFLVAACSGPKYYRSQYY